MCSARPSRGSFPRHIEANLEGGWGLGVGAGGGGGGGGGGDIHKGIGHQDINTCNLRHKGHQDQDDEGIKH